MTGSASAESQTNALASEQSFLYAEVASEFAEGKVRSTLRVLRK